MIDDRDLGRFTVRRTGLCGDRKERSPTRAQTLRVQTLLRGARRAQTLRAAPHPSAAHQCARAQPPLTAHTYTQKQSWLGFTIMVLLVAYHYVTADPKFAEQQRQQQ